MQDGPGPPQGGRGGRGRGGRGRSSAVMFARGGGGQRQYNNGADMGGGMSSEAANPAVGMEAYMGMDGMQRQRQMMAGGPMTPMDITPEMMVNMGPLGVMGALGHMGPMGALGPMGLPDFAAGPGFGRGMGAGMGGAPGQGPMQQGPQAGQGQAPGGPGAMGPMGMGPMGPMGMGLGPMGPMGMLAAAGQAGMGGGMAGPAMGGGGMLGMGMAGAGMPGTGMLGGGGPLGTGMSGGGMQGAGGMGPPGGGGGGAMGGGGGGGGGRAAGGPGGAPAGAAPPPPSSSSSASIANDYSQNFVDTGLRPQNYLRDSHLTDRYEEYPKLKELITRKDRQVATYATPPLFLRTDLRSLRLSPDTFGTKFDVILVDPPWEEYVRRAPGLVSDPEVWSWQEIQALEVEAIADSPCFLFLWCGAEEGLEAGRVCMQKWGFRRCEDICWIKTNRDQGRRGYLKAANQHPESMLVHTKEHCLMGIKGTVRRATDGHIIHTNVDTDVIVSEEPELGSTQKPEELYHVIEHFCNGRRRLELFGEDHNIRNGWVTVGKSLTSSNFSAKAYAEHFRNRDGSIWVQNVVGPKPPPGSVTLVPLSEEIEALRPKSPPGHHGNNN